MEYWLMSNDKKESLQLPVPPSQLQIARGNNNTVVNITTAGELNLIGKGKLATITLDTFFPSQAYPFCQYVGFPVPYDCVKLIEKWRAGSNPIRLIITETDINMAASIENFTHGEQDGTGDVYFTLELKEYRFVTIPTVAVATASTVTSSASVAAVRETPQIIATTYIVKKGDTLWAIAKKFTGSGTNYPAIATKNGIKNPNLIYPGQKVVI
jgi:nucleoid-associated protein YgaU